MGFSDPLKLTHVFTKRYRSPYVLKQAPRAWLNHLSFYLFDNVFCDRCLEACLFVQRSSSDTLLYSSMLMVIIKMTMMPSMPT